MTLYQSVLTGTNTHSPETVKADRKSKHSRKHENCTHSGCMVMTAAAELQVDVVLPQHDVIRALSLNSSPDPTPVRRPLSHFAIQQIGGMQPVMLSSDPGRCYVHVVDQRPNLHLVHRA